MAPEKSPPEKSQPGELPPGKLLIVDDHAGMAVSIQMVAEALGFACQTVNDPEEATAAYVAFKPDILILDMMMPEKDGLEVLQEVLRTRVPSRIILISGYGDGFLQLGRQMARGYQKQVVELLKKPFRREDLVLLLTAPPEPVN